MKQLLKLPTRNELEFNGMRVIQEQDGSEFAYTPYDEDAEFIVSACNNYLELISIVEQLIDADGISERRASVKKAKEMLRQITSKNK